MDQMLNETAVPRKPNNLSVVKAYLQQVGRLPHYLASLNYQMSLATEAAYTLLSVQFRESKGPDFSKLSGFLYLGCGRCLQQRGIFKEVRALPVRAHYGLQMPGRSSD